MICREQPCDGRSNEHLLPMVDALMADAGIGPRQLGMVAYGRGPGSFVGVRLAAAVAQGLALALDVPIYAESSLAALALGVESGSRVVALLDARLGEVYWAAYERREEVCVPLTGERVGRPQVVGDWLLESKDPAWVLAGDGCSLLDEVPGVSAFMAQARAIRPHARQILELSSQRFHAGEHQDFLESLPVYPRGARPWKRHA